MIKMVQGRGFIILGIEIMFLPEPFEEKTRLRTAHVAFEVNDV